MDKVLSLKLDTSRFRAVEPPADQAAPVDATIKVAGSDTMVNLAAAWAERYKEAHSNVDVQVSGGGSGVGIAKLIDGTVDLANASRDMKPKERKQASENAGAVADCKIAGTHSRSSDQYQ